jgi:hypothetical protein
MSNNPLFEFEDTDEKVTEWKGMPEFKQPDKTAYRQIIVSFEDEEGVEEFSRLVKQSLTKKTKSIWFPDRLTNHVSDLFYYDAENDEHPDA